jgi:hypothetical protein
MAVILLRDFFSWFWKVLLEVVLGHITEISQRRTRYENRLPQNRTALIQEYLKNLICAPPRKSVW